MVYCFSVFNRDLRTFSGLNNLTSSKFFIRVQQNERLKPKTLQKRNAQRKYVYTKPQYFSSNLQISINLKEYQLRIPDL